ncbi:glycosyl hydrolase [Marmoricola endophyticus]|uniref:Glycosyl hydrolase n=1 Tax=Marmoricola endophyticus TaxID=2040280 RepID=A0A917BB09_9ACTN|nr:glycosyl hydrolase [Marmoricola endophyticus]
MCVPVHQGEKHLARTMASVLAQDYPHLEVLVQDNQSTDGTARILAGLDDPRLRVLHTDTLLPIAANWNSLVEQASGDLVKVVCADDLIHPRAVSLQAEAMAADPGLALVSAKRHMISEDGALVAASRGLRGLSGRYAGGDAVRRVVRRGGNPIGEPACTMFRREQFLAENGFDASLLFPMDIDLWVRLLRHGSFLGIPLALAAFRLGASSISAALSAAQYADQQVFTDRIGSDPRWQLGYGRRAAGRAANVRARARHRALFVVSAWRDRRVGGEPSSRPDLEWLR